MEQEELRVKPCKVRGTDRAVDGQGGRASMLQWESGQASQSRRLLRLVLSRHSRENVRAKVGMWEEPGIVWCPINSLARQKAQRHV